MEELKSLNHLYKKAISKVAESHGVERDKAKRERDEIGEKIAKTVYTLFPFLRPNS